MVRILRRDFLQLYDSFAVMYAPCVGAIGMDLSRKCSRKALADSRNVSLNEPLPLYPELSGYTVCQIKKGMLKNLFRQQKKDVSAIFRNNRTQ